MGNIYTMKISFQNKRIYSNRSLQNKNSFFDNETYPRGFVFHINQ